MYSPKIRDDLIPQIYRAAKAAGIAMTTWVNQAVEKSLGELGSNDPGTGDGELNSNAERRKADHDRKRT